MKKVFYRTLVLILIVTMCSSMFYGCSDDEKENETQKQNSTEVEEPTLPPMTKDKITLKYMMWQDIEISEKLAEEFEIMYPNISVEVEEFSYHYSDDLQALMAVEKTPDCFWILGSPEVYIKNNLLYDMTKLWENDPDSKNIIKGINEFKIGYFGTDSKWTTPVKFFPSAAFVNMDVFNRNDVEMPSMDWTWEEFEDTVEKMTIEKDKETGKYVFGTTSGCTVITWYPLASDKSCIGEFGWNGTEYDMENWAYGMNLEAKWIQEEIKPYGLAEGGCEQLAEKYGEGVLYAADIGHSAIHIDQWWTWEDYWNTETYIEKNKVVFVPYIMPHTESAQDGNYIAIMDMGAISSTTKYPREAYELLKFMTWGTEGWKYKLKYYPDLYEKSKNDNRLVSKNHCPITLDKDVWEGFMKWHPNTEEGDTYMVDLYGKEYNRAEYFEYFFEQVQKGKWTCYGGQSIPGFGTWLDQIYYGNDGKQNFGYDCGLGIEQACIHGGVDAYKYYEYLEEQGNKMYHEKLAELIEIINNKEVETE